MTAAVAQADRAERLRSLSTELLARDGWSRARLEDHRRARLRALIEHVVHASPYYCETLGAAAQEAPFEHLPTLSKATLMDRWDDVVTDRRLRRTGVEAHLAGPHAATPYLGELQAFTTSGASGLRGLFVYGPEEWELWAAASFRALVRGGVTPDMRVVGIGAPDEMHSSKRLLATLQGGRADAPRLSVLTPMPEIVEALNAYRPDVIVGYASVANLLAAEQLAGRLDISPTFLALGSEPLTEAIRTRIRGAWGVDPAEYYAATEAFVIASSTRAHPRALELSEDLLIVEAVDAENRPVASGTAGAKLLLTSLESRVLPLIRYELSDRVTVAVAPNPTGRPYGHLTAIEGRAADTIVLASHDGTPVEILPFHLGAPFGRLPAVREFQVVNEPGRLLARIVLAPDAPDDTALRVEDGLAAVLEDAGAVAPAIEVTTVTALEREPGAAAKIKLVVNRV